MSHESSAASEWLLHCAGLQPIDVLQVLPVELPGSGLRMREPRKTCMQTLVHSMILALTPLLLQ